MAFYLFVRDLFGSEKVAGFSLAFMALPSPAFLAWTYMPNSYPETVLIGITTLWLAARIARRGTGGAGPVRARSRDRAGWWNSMR